MNKLDRYVSSCFLSSYGVCLSFFVSMFVLIDLFAKTEELIGRADKVAKLGYSVGRTTLEYYGLMAPFIFLQVAPFVTVMAAIFAITRLRRTNEFVPMIAAGRSAFRILMPMFVFALLLGIGMVLVQQFVAPGLADRRERLKELLFSAKTERLITQPFRPSEEVAVNVVEYDCDRHTIKFVDVSYLLSKEPSLTAENLTWDEQRQRFVYRKKGAPADAPLEVLDVDLSPDIIEAQARGPHDLSYSQAEFVYGKTGQAKYKVLLHYHLTFPLSNVLLLLLGLPFVLRLEKRSLMVGMVIAIVICASYFAFDAVMRNLGEKDALHPVLAAWFGVIFFGSLGVVLIDGVKT